MISKSPSHFILIHVGPEQGRQLYSSDLLFLCLKFRCGRTDGVTITMDDYPQLLDFSWLWIEYSSHTDLTQLAIVSKVMHREASDERHWSTLAHLRWGVGRSVAPKVSRKRNW
jgi:hypothetical protein